jgi:hypothetical protein
MKRLATDYGQPSSAKTKALSAPGADVGGGRTLVSRPLHAARALMPSAAAWADGDTEAERVLSLPSRHPPRAMRAGWTATSVEVRRDLRLRRQACACWLICGLALAIVVAAAGCGSSKKSAATTTVVVTSTVAAPTGAAPTTAGTSADFATFGDGTYTVGSSVKAGTYRAPDPASTCYWERLAGFSGDLNDTLANDIATDPTVVTILPTDAGFKTEGCGTWTSDLSAITSSKTSFPAGTYIVNVDITAGTYSAPGGNGCSWARLSGFTGDPGDIIANDLPSGSLVVTIAPSDRGFQSSNCGTFTATGPPAAQLTPQPPVAASPPVAQPKAKSAFSQCDDNVEALKGTTSCAFAENVFYEFYENSPEPVFPVYSPSTGATYSMSCTVESRVTCTGGNGAEVRFPLSAVQAYTDAAARAYANSHDVGHATP